LYRYGAGASDADTYTFPSDDSSILGKGFKVICRASASATPAQPGFGFGIGKSDTVGLYKLSSAVEP
jgi:hypothetical protein